MRRITEKLAAAASSPMAIPAGLLAITVLAYGLFFWQLGFYWDDQPMSWIRYQMGPETMRRYFSTSRPIWGELYQITTRLFPHVPAYWQAFAVLCRWVTGILCWLVFQTLWPQARRTALTIACLFLLYPGFNLQWVSYLSSHLFVVLAFFLLSLLLTLWSLRRPNRYWPLTILALVFSALNLWMMEYFFFLELTRPFLIIALLARLSPPKSARDIRAIALEAAGKWLPYLGVWILNVLYRALVFSNLAYRNELLTELQTQPLASAAELLQTVLSNLWLVSGRAWGAAFWVPSPAVDGTRTMILYAAVVLAVALLLAFLLRHTAQKRPISYFAFELMTLGVIALLAGGISFWLAKVVLTLGFPATRFTISFILGVSLVVAGVIELLPKRSRSAVAMVLVALAAGRQAVWAESFRHEWNTEANMFWQMTWRAPGLRPDTTVLMNQDAFVYEADNSLGAALNWIYDPDNHTTSIRYVLLYPTNRVGGASLPGFDPDLPIHYNHFLVGRFAGNTSQVVAFYYQPPSCLRLLDPLFDAQNHFVDDASLMRETARLSSSQWITPETSARIPEIYGPEPVHGWCYYFERAELAAQEDDWQRVAELGAEAFRLNDHPNNPIERFVYIEGFAHNGLWSRALEQSAASYKVSKQYVGPLLCALWERIGSEAPESTQKAATVAEARSLFACPP